MWSCQSFARRRGPAAVSRLFLPRWACCILPLAKADAWEGEGEPLWAPSSPPSGTADPHAATNARKEGEGVGVGEDGGTMQVHPHFHPFRPCAPPLEGVRHGRIDEEGTGRRHCAVSTHCLNPNARGTSHNTRAKKEKTDSPVFHWKEKHT